MAASETRISAYISRATKEKLERYAEAHGVKKGFLIEEALLHHLQALSELPSDVVIPQRITVKPATFRKLVAMIEKPRKPTKAMRDLMAGRPVKGAPADW